MSFEDFLRGLSFHLLDPRMAPDENRRFHLRRPDGSTVTLLDHDVFTLERSNTRLPAGSPLRQPGFLDLAAIPKMSTFTIGAILNRAVAEMSPDAAYVNVGVWHGYSFLAGLYGNRGVRAVGIDDFSLEAGEPRAAFLSRFEPLSDERRLFFERDFREVFREGLPGPIGAYFYDGGHSYADQLDGLRLAEPYFAEDCVIAVDDSDWRAPRQATLDFVEQSPREYSVVLDVSTAGTHPTLWNGLLVLRMGPDPGSGPITRIPAPALPAAEPPSTRPDETVVMLIDGSPGEAAVSATLRAIRAQGYRDLEIHTFGPRGTETDGVEHHDSAADALAASEGAYALLLEAGLRPGETAVAEALEKVRS